MCAGKALDKLLPLPAEGEEAKRWVYTHQCLRASRLIYSVGLSLWYLTPCLRLCMYVALFSGWRQLPLVMEQPRCCAELMDLREKFAEDKRRIAEMKAARKFKPV